MSANLFEWKITTSRKIAALICSVAFLSLLGCGPSNADDDTVNPPRPKPSAEELRKATNPRYATPIGTRQECLGRLVFDVQRDMHWGINAPSTTTESIYGFTNNMHGGHDAVHVANLQIVVSAPAKLAALDRLLESIASEKSYAVHQYREMNVVNKRIIEKISAVLKDPSKNVNNEDMSNSPSDIGDIKREITDIETKISNIEKNWHPIELGIPDSKGYQAGPDRYAFLYRDGRTVLFLSSGGEYEVRERVFYDTVKRFQFRKLYEIPKQPGICIPYGFIPDDGRTYFDTEVSLRYADRPGVIYTINTGIVGEEGNLGPEPTLLHADARAAISELSRFSKRVQKSIGPRTVRIGALPADQGAISLNVSDPGNPPVYNYSAYTGYSGWWNSHVLPFITVDMRSFTKEQEPSLKSNPPPFDESMTRLDLLLKSIRLRPTDPVMPELREIATVK